MNIGHLTLLHGYNYGGMLQAYATQSILKSHGHTVLTLDYHPWKKHDLVRKASFFCKPVYDSIRKFLDKGKYSGVDAFDDFRRLNFQFSAPCQTNTQLSLACKSLDYVVVGSDQIWSASWTRSPYFLDFDVPQNCKKVSLSACCGTPSDDKLFRDLLSKTVVGFDAISVRNDFTAGLVEDCSGRKDVAVLCDPTLACSIPTVNVPGNPAPYALVYIINRPISIPLATHAIKQLKLETDLSVVSIPPAELKGHEVLPCDLVHSNISPFQWAWLIENASVVITDSFHGTVFAAKYHKPLVILDSGFRANNRLHAIARDLQIESAIVSDENSLNISSVMTKSQGWDIVDSQISARALDYHSFVSTHIPN